MIDTFYFALGFFFYISFTLLVFNVYSQKQNKKNYFILSAIYLYNSLLMGYVINFIDSNASFFERFIQMMIYFFVGIAVLYYNFFSDSKKQGDYDSQL